VSSLTTAKIFGTGQITLPKKWRDKYKGLKNIIIEETSNGLFIKPLRETVYFEEENGDFGLNFPNGIDAEEFYKKFKETDERLG